MKKQKGITLVALVITIIVLLILAAVSISLAIGQNGVLTRSSEAIKENEKAKIREELNLTVNDAETMAYTRRLGDAGANYDASTPYFETSEDGSEIGLTGIKIFENNCTIGVVTMLEPSVAKPTVADNEYRGLYVSRPDRPIGEEVYFTNGSNNGLIAGYYTATNGSNLVYEFVIDLVTGRIVIADGMEVTPSITDGFYTSTASELYPLPTT